MTAFCGRGKLFTYTKRSGVYSGRDIQMNSHQNLKGARTSRVDRWCGNTCESITRIPNAGEHAEQLIVVNYK